MRNIYITIQTHPTQIVISLKIIGVQNLLPIIFLGFSV